MGTLVSGTVAGTVGAFVGSLVSGTVGALVTLLLLVPQSYIMLMNQCQFNIILYSLDILVKFHFL
jgi:chromate transport protein ChrA